MPNSKNINKTNRRRKGKRRRLRKVEKKFIKLVAIFSAAGLVMVAAVIAMVSSLLPNPTPTARQDIEATPTPTQSAQPTPAPTPEPTPDPMAGKVHSPITGLPIAEENAPLRPIAVVINNHSRALPQSGISEAEVIYEVLAEGDITRLVAIFHELTAEKIGPVRSTRDYFTDFAIDKDAVFVHHGGSPSGYERLRDRGINNLDGMALEGTTFWRDAERRRLPGMFEHSSYTGAEALEATIERREIRRERREDDGIGFQFNLDEIPFQTLGRATGGDYRECKELTIPFSTAYTRRFVYDPDEMVFAVYNRNGPHIDDNIENKDEAQIRVTNILVQKVKMSIVPGDTEGRREIQTVGTGDGYLATQGGIIAVRWEKASHSEPTRWYFMNGNPLQLTPGNTWINVLQETASIGVVTGQEDT